MRRIAQVFAVAAALAAFPAFADQGREGSADPPRALVPGSERDPFSQTYTGRDPEEVRGERARELRAEIDGAARTERERAASRAQGSCSCGHEAGAQHGPKA